MPEASGEDRGLAGVRLRHTLWRHQDRISRVAWSPDGLMLASASFDTTVGLWDADTGALLRSLRGHTGPALSVAWSPDGRWLASGSQDSTVRLWNMEYGKRRVLEGHVDWVLNVTWSPDSRILASASADGVLRLWDGERKWELRHTISLGQTPYSLVWSPDGSTLAVGCWDGTIELWDPTAGKIRRVLASLSAFVYSLSWSPDGQWLASGSDDSTIQIWDAASGQHRGVLEGHTGAINGLSFSAGGELLTSKSADHTVRIWRFDTWETVALLEEPVDGSGTYGLAHHPHLPVLATLGEGDTVIRLWELDLPALLASKATTGTLHYTNAKVVLLGDTGVGKSALGLVLTGQAFVPTESTHGRYIWMFDSQEVDLGNGRKETREALLWDLAGQPSYRLIHQLHLNEVTVALVVFDARSDTDPFAGVTHWDRALRQAQRLQGDLALPLRKFLVAARTDRGGIGASRERIDTLCSSLGFDGYFATSAREGWSIPELITAIHRAIPWQAMPKVSSTELFQKIKTFLLEEKEAGRILSSVDELYRAFLKSGQAPEAGDALRAQFETCIGLVESRGLIRRLSFGGLALLQPELLDAYASAIVNAAKDEPDGLGCIAEESARTMRFRISQDERLRDRGQERLLLMATIEDLLQHEIALREQAEDGPLLVFPSQFTRENPDLPDPEEKAVVFRFDGPIQSIYATLAVRLSHCGLFKRREMWRNAATYTAIVGGVCGIILQEIEEGRGEIILFFDSAATEVTRFQFEEYIHCHLLRRALPESIQRRRIFQCEECGFQVTDQLSRMRLERGFAWLDCPVCGARLSLLDREQRLEAKPSLTILEMDRAADAQRERDAGLMSASAEMQTHGFKSWVGSSKTTLALIFTDMVGSTALGNELGNERMREVRRAHFKRARHLIAQYNGYAVKTIGDGILATFRTAVEAFDFALELYRDPGHLRVQIRAGIHIGPVEIEEGDVFGATVNYAARLVDYTREATIRVSDEARRHIDQMRPEPDAQVEWQRHTDCEIYGFSGRYTLWTAGPAEMD